MREGAVMKHGLYSFNGRVSLAVLLCLSSVSLDCLAWNLTPLPYGSIMLRCFAFSRPDMFTNDFGQLTAIPNSVQLGYTNTDYFRIMSAYTNQFLPLSNAVYLTVSPTFLTLNSVPWELNTNEGGASCFTAYDSPAIYSYYLFYVDGTTEFFSFETYDCDLVKHDFFTVNLSRQLSKISFGTEYVSGTDFKYASNGDFYISQYSPSAYRGGLYPGVGAATFPIIYSFHDNIELSQNLILAQFIQQFGYTQEKTCDGTGTNCATNNVNEYNTEVNYYYPESGDLGVVGGQFFGTPKAGVVQQFSDSVRLNCNFIIVENIDDWIIP